MVKCSQEDGQALVGSKAGFSLMSVLFETLG